jgi:hypothetical protein
MLDQIFIPEIAEIIRDYTYPDYRKMFDFVVRDINWVAGCRALHMFYKTLPRKEYRRARENIIMSHVMHYTTVSASFAIHLITEKKLQAMVMSSCWGKRFFGKELKLS